MDNNSSPPIEEVPYNRVPKYLWPRIGWCVPRTLQNTPLPISPTQYCHRTGEVKQGSNCLEVFGVFHAATTRAYLILSWRDWQKTHLWLNNDGRLHIDTRLSPAGTPPFIAYYTIAQGIDLLRLQQTQLERPIHPRVFLLADQYEQLAEAWTW
jgi:hypothetical protein